VISFPDTSFLCALYVRQYNSETAAAHFAAMQEELHVSGLLLYEFRQSVRFQVWLHSRDKTKGYPPKVAEAALGNLEMNIQARAVVPVSIDWPDVHRLAETISTQRTSNGGHRAFDILHIATALHLGAREFLTFDANQRKLALAEKLRVQP
jgi:predicted nucleic acid-binding protein